MRPVLYSADPTKETCALENAEFAGPATASIRNVSALKYLDHEVGRDDLSEVGRCETSSLAHFRRGKQAFSKIKRKKSKIIGRGHRSQHCSAFLHACHYERILQEKRQPRVCLL